MKAKESKSFELVWDYAAEEASFLGFEFIELQHFFLSILKFPNFSAEDVDKYKDRDRGPISEHQDEMQEIKDYLDFWEIDTKLLIKQIESDKSLPPKEFSTSRSNASKKMFADIENNVRKENREQLRALDMLRYLVDNQVHKKYIDNETSPTHNNIKTIDLPIQDNVSQVDVNDFQNKLLEKVIGQDQAVKTFSQVIGRLKIFENLDKERKCPQAVFVFAGPPGVGKTLLAETAADLLGRPKRRFDMSGYSEHQQHESLIGVSTAYKTAKLGLLTDYVSKNKNAVLIFDEIEKAHSNTIHLFLQILDHGVLEDKFTEENVSFRDTIIIFTTNAGKKLYDKTDLARFSNFHSKTIINALENEKDVETGKPFFPPPICSRLSAGYVMLFNHIGINDMANIVRSRLNKIKYAFSEEFNISFIFDDILPYLLVMKESANSDARTISSQAGNFIESEIQKNLQYCFPNAKELEIFSKLNQIVFDVEDNVKSYVEKESGKSLFSPTDKPNILLIANPIIIDNYKKIEGVNWFTVDSREAWTNYSEREIDIVLLDPWIREMNTDYTKSYINFEVSPATSKRFELGRKFLSEVRKKLPDTPVCFLSIQKEGDKNKSSKEEDIIKVGVQEGGVRETIISHFTSSQDSESKNQLDDFKGKIQSLWDVIYIEKVVAKLSQEHKVLDFETHPDQTSEKVLKIKLRNPELKTALIAEDFGEILDEYKMPKERFENVIGAESAKEALKTFIDYLNKKEKLRKYDIKPDKGVLLYGPSGTGKTMLARAFAGEAKIRFLYASAANFITSLQGSGPQNIRELFSRARKYAPSVIFIDEIDAIGKTRTGGYSQQSVESTLNTLLVEMDGFNVQSPERPVFVLAATNFNIDESGTNNKASLDSALIRRFTKRIFIDLPDKSSRIQFLTSRLADRPGIKISSNSIKNIADRTVGMSFADLDATIESAKFKCDKNGIDLDDKILNDEFEEGSGQKIIMDSELKKKIAYHEAAHTVLYWKSGKYASYVTIVSRGNQGGYMAEEASDAENTFFTKEELLWKIRVALAGRAIEQIRFTENELSTSVTNDLEHASKLVHQMITKLGMYQEYGIYIDPEFNNQRINVTTSQPEIINLANKILKEQLQCTKDVLRENIKYVEKVKEELLIKDKLTQLELKKILPSKTTTM